MILRTVTPSLRLLLGAGLCATLSGVLAGCGHAPEVPEADEGGSASCAALIEYNGSTYQGAGPLSRTPETTGRTMSAVLPGCDDSGGAAGSNVVDEPVLVLELARVDASVAVLFQNGLYVRDGAQLPAEVRAWFRAPRCSTPETFDVTADWLGVTGPNKVRFDGDIRPPYRLEVRVVSGPEQYVGTTVMLDATAATEPRLGPDDVKQTLREGGQVAATLRCVDGGFDVVGVRSVR